MDATVAFAFAPLLFIQLETLRERGMPSLIEQKLIAVLNGGCD